MMPKLLIWDWNGTIIDDTDLCIEIENELLRERGMPRITKDWYLSHFFFPVRRYYEYMGYTFETEPFETVAEIFMERYRARYAACPLREGVAGLLKTVNAHGIRQALLSVTKQNDLAEQVESFGISALFSEILGQDDSLCVSKVERAKAYMQSTGISPQDALFIGDTDHDAEAAKAVGSPCVLLCGGHQSKEVLSACGAPVYDSAVSFGKALFI